MTENYEYIGPLCVIVAGLLYGIADYFCNGGRVRRLDLFDGLLDQITEENKLLVLTRFEQEVIRINDNIEVCVVEVRRDNKTGRFKVRLGITAPAEVSIHREEVYQRKLLEQHEPELGGEG